VHARALIEVVTRSLATDGDLLDQDEAAEISAGLTRLRKGLRYPERSLLLSCCSKTCTD
jgi:hypothetical protein